MLIFAAVNGYSSISRTGLGQKIIEVPEASLSQPSGIPSISTVAVTASMPGLTDIVLVPCPSIISPLSIAHLYVILYLSPLITFAVKTIVSSGLFALAGPVTPIWGH